MHFSELDLHKDILEEICRRHHVRELALFGSVLRDDFGEDSDIDVLVEFEPGARVGLIEFVDLKEELSVLLGRNVDLGSKNGLHEHIREHVLDTAQTIYTASSGYRAPTKLDTTQARSATPVDRDLLRLHVAAESCGTIAELVAGDGRAGLEANDIRRGALLFALLQLGEAIKNVSPELKACHPDIPWQRVIDAGASTVGLDRHDRWDEHWMVAATVVPDIHQRVRDILATRQSNDQPQE